MHYIDRIINAPFHTGPPVLQRSTRGQDPVRGQRGRTRACSPAVTATTAPRQRGSLLQWIERGGEARASRICRTEEARGSWSGSSQSGTVFYALFYFYFIPCRLIVLQFRIFLSLRSDELTLIRTVIGRTKCSVAVAEDISRTVYYTLSLIFISNFWMYFNLICTTMMMIPRALAIQISRACVEF